MNWVNAVVETYAENEAPEVFFYWSALSALSAVMRKGVYLDRFTAGRLYPNIYVFIVADSGMRKGTPIVAAKNLVTMSGAARIISGRTSIPAVIKDLGKAYTLENGGIVDKAQAFILSGELAAFLVQDPNGLTILTDLHDTGHHEDKWINSLKGSGVDELKAPCITLLGATNEDHFPEAVPQNAIGGGFIARTFIVYAREGGTPNSQTERPRCELNLKSLASYLTLASRVTGEFKWSNSGKDVFNDWYYDHKKTQLRDPTGTLNRLDSQILKVGMLLSLARDFDLTLRDNDISEAIAVSKECTIGMKQVTMGSGKSTTSYQVRLVLRELMLTKEHTISRSTLLARYWGDLDYFDLDRVIETLLGAGAIEVRQSGTNAIYILKPGVYEEYNHFRKQIM